MTTSHSQRFRSCFLLHVANVSPEIHRDYEEVVDTGMTMMRELGVENSLGPPSNQGSTGTCQTSWKETQEDAGEERHRHHQGGQMVNRIPDVDVSRNFCKGGVSPRTRAFLDCG
jgi:hypothetical protein